MPPLKWDVVGANLDGGRQSVNFNETFNPLAEAIARMDKTQRAERAVGGIQQALGIDDPELFIEAARRGNFDITPENWEFFTGRVGQLLGEQKSRQDMSLAASQEERAKIQHAAELKTRGITDAKSTVDLNDAILKFDKAKEIMTLAPEAAKRAAAIRLRASEGDIVGAQRLLADGPTQEMLIRGGWDREGISGFSESLDKAYEAAMKAEEQGAAHAELVGDRPEQERLRDLKRQTEFGSTESQLLKQDREREIFERGVANDKEQEAREDAAKAAFEDLVNGPYGGSVAALHEGARSYPGLDPATRSLLTQAIEKAAGGFAKLTPEQIVAEMYAGDPNAPRGPRQAGEGYTAPAGSMVGLIDQTEGGGDYSTLYGHSQKEGGQFAGVDVSTMTIGELNQFANSGYKAWVAGQNNGTAASPMGRYQIVNDTLQSAARTLGLSPDTVFDKNTQDKIFTFLINQRLGSRGGIEGQMYGLRQEWAGLKNVDDATLRKAIEDFKQGDPDFGNKPQAGGSLSGLQSAISGPLGVTPGAPTVDYDETYGAAARKFTEELLKQKGPMTGQQLDILNQQEQHIQESASIVTDALTLKDTFGGQTPALLAAMQDPANVNKSLTDVVREEEEKFGTIKGKQITDEVNYVVEKYGVLPGVAAAFIEAAPRETLWANIARDDEHIDRGKIDKLFSTFYDIDIKDPELRSRGALELMQMKRKETASADSLKQLQGELREAMTEAANISAKKRTSPNVDDKRAIRRVTLLQEKLDKELRALDKYLTQSDTKEKPAEELDFMEKIFGESPYKVK